MLCSISQITLEVSTPYFVAGSGIKNGIDRCYSWTPLPRNNQAIILDYPIHGRDRGQCLLVEIFMKKLPDLLPAPPGMFLPVFDDFFFYLGRSSVGDALKEREDVPVNLQVLFLYSALCTYMRSVVIFQIAGKVPRLKNCQIVIL